MGTERRDAMERDLAGERVRLLLDRSPFEEHCWQREEGIVHACSHVVD